MTKQERIEHLTLDGWEDDDVPWLLSELKEARALLLTAAQTTDRPSVAGDIRAFLNDEVSDAK